MQTQITEAPSLKAPGKANRPAAKPRKPKLTLAARLASHVDTFGGLFACHHCDLSIMQANGYPQIKAPSPITGKPTMRNAHTVAWEVHNGMPVPEGKIVLHAQGCSKTCCNPAHLRLGTHAENTADKVQEGRAGRRLTKAQVLEIAHLGTVENVSIPALATRFKTDHSNVRNILRGKTHSKLTGIERNRRVGGGKAKSAAPVPAPAPAPVIVLDNHRQTRKARKPELVAATH